MISEPKFDMLKLRNAVLIRLQIKREDIRREMPLAITELNKALAAEGVRADGPLFVHHLTTSSSHFDMNVGYPLKYEDGPEDIGRMRLGAMPGGMVAHTTYTGGYEGLFKAWDEFGTALGKSGCEGSGSILEVYTKGPESDPNPETWRTDLYVLLKA